MYHSWGGFASGSVLSAISTELCVGSSPFGCQLAPFAPVAPDNAGSKLGTVSPVELSCGFTYHVSLRSTNCAGLSNVVTSNGVKICCSPPTGGVAKLLHASGKLLHRRVSQRLHHPASALKSLGRDAPCSLSVHGTRLHTLWREPHRIMQNAAASASVVTEAARFRRPHCQLRFGGDERDHFMAWLP